MKKNKYLWIVCCFLACLSAFSLEIFVIDKDLDFPLEGVQLSLENTITYTNENGYAYIELSSTFKRGMLIAYLPGYAQTKIPVNETQKFVQVLLSISEIIEGKELVVERSKPGVSDSKAAVSVVMTKDEMEPTANFGLVEDVMSSIKTLPGVNFSGGFNSQPSIRGGYPDEMGTVLDGFYVYNPFHWGGAFSIFNPNMVSSAKMSHGIFSARYGRAMSGLLEVTSKDFNSSEPRVEAAVATNSFDVFVQIPFENRTGLFLGGTVSYLEPLGFFNDEILNQKEKLKDTIPTLPFIRDFYTKFLFSPHPSFDISVNAFIGSDGIGVDGSFTDDDFKTQALFNWLYIQGFLGLNVQWMINNTNRIHFISSYNQNYARIDANINQTGNKDYSQAFKEKFSDTIGNRTGFTLQDFNQKVDATQRLQIIQGKLEYEQVYSPNILTSYGGELVGEIFTDDQFIQGWVLINDEKSSRFFPANFDRQLPGNKILNSAAYGILNYGNDASLLQGELGLRLEHFYLWNNNFSINANPTLDPRFNISWNPKTKTNLFQKTSLSFGTGLFSMFPLDSIAADAEMGLGDISISPNRAWFSVIGLDLELSQNWFVKAETYYKYYFNRLYINGHIDETNQTQTISPHTNGKGFSFGADCMIQKKEGRYFDGYLSYSFNYAMFINPTKNSEDLDVALDGSPLGTWFFPTFHRFHNLNLILNWKPAPGFTFTTKLTVASGTPRRKIESIDMLCVEYGEEYIEYYVQNTSFSNSLRNGISCPVDFRIAYSNYYKNSKIRWEVYFGLENAFVNLYKPKGNSSFDAITGKEIPDSNTADFDIGIPIPSFGWKISY